MGFKFDMEKQIYYHDTDAGGVVYYGRYLNYLEEARTEYFLRQGIDLNVIRQKKFLYAVRKCSLTYKSPARYGDTIVCTARLLKTTAAQLVFEQKVHDKPTGRLILEAEVTLVCLTENFKPTPIPEKIKSKLEKS